MKGYKIILPKQSYNVIADVRKRGLAYVIDLLVFFFFIAIPFTFLYYSLSGVPFDAVSVEVLLEDPVLLRIVSIGEFISYSLFFFYLTGSELMMNATIGKKLMNLRVISRNKRKPSLLQLMIRNISKSLSIQLLPFDSLLMFFDPEHRRLLDYVSNTLVVEDKKKIKTFPVVNEV